MALLGKVPADCRPPCGSPHSRHWAMFMVAMLQRTCCQPAVSYSGCGLTQNVLLGAAFYLRKRHNGHESKQHSWEVCTVFRAHHAAMFVTDGTVLGVRVCYSVPGQPPAESASCLNQCCMIVIFGGAVAPFIRLSSQCGLTDSQLSTM